MAACCWGSTGFRPRCLRWWIPRLASRPRRLLLCRLPSRSPRLRCQTRLQAQRQVRRWAHPLCRRRLPRLQGLPLPHLLELPRRQRHRSPRPNRRCVATWTPALRPIVRLPGPTAPISRATGRGGFAQNRSCRLIFAGPRGRRLEPARRPRRFVWTLFITWAGQCNSSSILPSSWFRSARCCSRSIGSPRLRRNRSRPCRRPRHRHVPRWKAPARRSARFIRKE